MIIPPDWIELARIQDFRSHLAEGHSERTARLARAIGAALKLSGPELQDLYIGGLLHDIGKIAIPESILNKPGPLTHEEYETVKRHPEEGCRFAADRLGIRRRRVLDIILYHHERYDGLGYPFGISDIAIPFAARVVGAADAFDAMISARAYREHPRSLKDALREIRAGRGRQFDARIADVLVGIASERNCRELSLALQNT